MNSHTLASVCKSVLQNEDATVKACLFNFLPTWLSMPFINILVREEAKTLASETRARRVSPKGKAARDP